jgi:hypothetical protein
MKAKTFTRPILVPSGVIDLHFHKKTRKITMLSATWLGVKYTLRPTLGRVGPSTMLPWKAVGGAYADDPDMTPDMNRS